MLRVGTIRESSGKAPPGAGAWSDPMRPSAYLLLRLVGAGVVAAKGRAAQQHQLPVGNASHLVFLTAAKAMLAKAVGWKARPIPSLRHLAIQWPAEEPPIHPEERSALIPAVAGSLSGTRTLQTRRGFRIARLRPSSAAPRPGGPPS